MGRNGGNCVPNIFSRSIMVAGSFAVVTIPNYHIGNLLDLIETLTEAGSEH